jgi:hypothetical protein
MATTRTAPASTTPSSQDGGGLFEEIRDFWRQFIVAAFDPYRPELHYMRGPGPACHAKKSASRSH